MIVRSVDRARGTEREVRGRRWASTRLLLRDDGMGFSMCETLLEPGMDEVLEYKHHLEACFCIEGAAEVEDLATGERFEIRARVRGTPGGHDNELSCQIDNDPEADRRPDRQPPVETAGASPACTRRPHTLACRSVNRNRCGGGTTERDGDRALPHGCGGTHHAA